MDGRGGPMTDELLQQITGLEGSYILSTSYDLCTNIISSRPAGLKMVIMERVGQTKHSSMKGGTTPNFTTRCLHC